MTFSITNVSERDLNAVRANWFRLRMKLRAAITWAMCRLVAWYERL
jgi:hypothetical protein